MMKILASISLMIFLLSCVGEKEVSSVAPINWANRAVDYPVIDSLIEGSSYLSVYAQIYSQTEHRRHGLTATVSMRNTNRKDTIYIDELDIEGGTGANFLFDWKIKPTSNEPLFEGVMISTSGQQGLSFTTQGIRIH